jgi:D-alanyl-D-alanine carboxypeptidase
VSRSPSISRADVWQRLGIPADYPVRRGLPVQREATRLVTIGRNPDGRTLKLAPAAAAAWARMRAAAADDDIILVPLSAFRSVRRQTKIIREHLANGRPLDDILRFVAAPGCSEHHTGRALDIGSPEYIELDEHFARTAAFRWLKRHAHEFGFRLSYPARNPHGIGYEPWHWCWHR